MSQSPHLVPAWHEVRAWIHTVRIIRTRYVFLLSGMKRCSYIQQYSYRLIACYSCAVHVLLFSHELIAMYDNAVRGHQGCECGWSCRLLIVISWLGLPAICKLIDSIWLWSAGFSQPTGWLESGERSEPKKCPRAEAGGGGRGAPPEDPAGGKTLQDFVASFYTQEW